MSKDLKSRARAYAHIISVIFQDQKLSGARLVQADRAARHLTLGLRLNDSTELQKALKLSESIALASNVENVIAQRSMGFLLYQFQLNQGFWKSYTRADLSTTKAIGIAERQQSIEFDLNGSPHSLIAGTTGSGKTETVKSILVSLMLTYTVDELNLIICDAHSDLMEFDSVAHLAIPIARSQEEMSNALLFSHQQLTERKEKNIRDGKYLIVVIDEAGDTLESDESKAIVKTLCREGRKFRIHVILGIQKASHKALPDILDLLNNRFIGLVSDARVSSDLTGHAGLEAHKLTGSGDFIHVAGQEIQRFQVAQATRADFERLERAEIKSITVEPDLIIPLEIETKKAGRPKLEVRPEYAAMYYYYDNKISHAQAQDSGISRNSHELHRDFIAKFALTLEALRTGELAL